MSYLYLFLLLITITNEVQFAFKILPNNKYCVGEYLTENTIAIFGIITTTKNYQAQVFDPKNRILYTKSNELEIKLSLTATESGNHQICILNKEKNEIQIDFEFLSGIQAQDYTDIAKESNLKPVETSVKKVEDTINLLINDLTSVTKEEDRTLAVNDSINSNIISFSLITLGAMIVIGAVETFYLKKFMERRKII